MAAPRTIKSVGDLLKILVSNRNKHDNPFWYRGHADYGWHLLPNLLRSNEHPSEATLLLRFKQSASLLVSNRPNSEFEWLFLMQHYGLPTRLLDWSENPLVALYFAVNSSPQNQDKDGSFWVLNPVALNAEAHISSASEKNFIPSFEDNALQSYKPETLRSEDVSELNPVAAIAERNNSRIQAQLGVFTIYHRITTPIEDIGKTKHVTKHKIPVANKKGIQNELAALGFNRFQLFPELASISNSILEA